MYIFYTYFHKYIPKYFTLFDVVNQIIFLISCSGFSLLVYTIGFHLLYFVFCNLTDLIH